MGHLPVGVYMEVPNLSVYPQKVCLARHRNPFRVAALYAVCGYVLLAPTASYGSVYRHASHYSENRGFVKYFPKSQTLGKVWSACHLRLGR